MLSQVAPHVYRRAVEYIGTKPKEYDVPAWTPVIILLDIIVFLPVFTYVWYTLNKVYPTLAMIEDENPPAYEPLALNATEDGIADAGPLPVKTDGTPRAVTSSIRATGRLLRSNGGLKAYFRGFFCLLFQVIATSFLQLIFSAGRPGPFAFFTALIANLALVQFSAAWVHIIMTVQSPKHFWSRIPAFKRTFDATWRPICAYWLAAGVASLIPWLLIKAFQLHAGMAPPPNSDGDVEGPVDTSLAWKGPVIFLATFAAQVFLVLPAQIVLVRVQAGLLDPDEETIVPFDRSFQGKVEPAVIGGKGYPTMRQAWESFSRAAWRRLLVLYVKIFLWTMGIFTLMTLVIIPEAVLIAAYSTEKKD